MTKTRFVFQASRTPSSRLETLRSALVALAALFAFGLFGATPARAAIGTPDVVPAATLLLPYFEVDLANENGPQTSIKVTNASATAVLLNVTLWTDYGVPTYSFPVYQVGYNTTDIDLRLLFKGIPPASATAGQDPLDQISPKGTLSQDINFASCNGVLPMAKLSAATINGLRSAHTGQSSTLLGGNCGGAAHGDNIARGYVTIDAVNSCSSPPAYPSDPGYLAPGGTGRATNQNVLTGTVLYLNRSTKSSFNEPLVHIEAAPGITVGGTNAADPLTTSAGANTFYGRYVGFAASDNREALPSISQGRFINGGVFNAATELVVWRDPGIAVSPFACGGTPAGFPLPQAEVVAFDEQEHPVPITGFTFPLVAQRVSTSGLLPFNFGYIRLNLTLFGGNPAVAGRNQSYVSMRYTSSGIYSGSVPAQQINNAGSPASTNFHVVN